MSTVTNLAKNLTDTTRAHAGRVAVRVDNAAMTYRALDDASARVAGLLHERGLKPGDRVGIMMPNVAEVPVVYYGVLRAGGVVVPMNPLLKAREVAYYLGDSGAGLIFAWHAFADQARGGAEQAEAESIVVDEVGFPDLLASATPDYQVADAGDDDTAVILYTSGTTGHPKGAELTHGNVGHARGLDAAELPPGLGLALRAGLSERAERPAGPYGIPTPRAGPPGRFPMPPRRPWVAQLRRGPAVLQALASPPALSSPPPDDELLDSIGPLDGTRVLVIGHGALETVCGLIRRGCTAAEGRPAAGWRRRPTWRKRWSCRGLRRSWRRRRPLRSPRAR